MNLKLNELNQAYEYASIVCKDLADYGYDVKPITYSVHDNRKGICLKIFDNCGNVYNEYYSGICDDLESLNDSIDKIRNRILKEC